MTITLSAEQSALYDNGGWDSFRVEETIIEDLQRQHITEPVVVTLENGAIVFAVYQGEIA
jgi:hypothetical protein